ncbi:MAG: hypothetical protein ACOVNV_02785, partial [Pirellulaceae bacterium]
ERAGLAGATTDQISRSVLRYAIEKKEALLVFDAAKDERFKDSQSILDFSIRSAIIAPIVLSNETPIGAMGDWAVTLPEVAPGVYVLRADQLDGTGKVTSRFETPFKR